MNNSRKGNTMKEARAMKNLKVVTKKVLIEGHEFVLISFDSYDEMVKYYGDRTYALIDYKHLDENGRMNKVLTHGEMAPASSPAQAIENMRKQLLCTHWRAEHPNATEQEFVQYLLTVYAA